MHFIISPKFKAKPSTEVIIEMAQERGYDALIPSRLSSINSIFPKNQFSLIWGEQAFAEFIAQEMNMNLYQNSPDWLSKLQWSLIKRNIRICSMKELKASEQERVKRTSSLHHADLCREIYPLDDYDAFPGGKYNDFPDAPDELKVQYEIINKKINYEATFLILGKKIVDWHCIRDGDISNSQSILKKRTYYNNIDAEGFLNNVLNLIHIAPSTIINVAYLEEIGWVILSTKPVWCSPLGFFNPKHFLNALISSMTFYPKY